MKLTRPTNVTFWIAVAFAVLGLLGQIGAIAALAPYAFWLVVVGFVILMLGNLVKGI